MKRGFAGVAPSGHPAGAAAAWAGLAAAALLAAALAAFPLSGVCVTRAGTCIQGWIGPWVRRLAWPALAVAVAGGWALWRWAGRRLAGSRWGEATRGLAWLPALVLAPSVMAPIDRTLAGLVLPLGGAFLAATALERILRPGGGGAPAAAPPSRPLRAAWTWFALTALALFAFWRFAAVPQRFASGDEQHYEMQVENLLEHGNVDLTERAEAMMAEDGIGDDPELLDSFFLRYHFTANANGRIHTYHSSGFPLLAWPFRAAFGRTGDGLLLALLGALALCGVRAACRVHGASRRMADAVSALTGLSYLWVYTAMSFLPEMLGFGLVAWAFWAVAAQGRPERRWRWGATAVAAVACGYLPVAHIRFLPTAGMLAACFGVEGLWWCRDESFWKAKVPRLGLFSAFCFAAWGVLWAVHSTMFRGAPAYKYGEIAGHELLVMWAIFADRRGVSTVVPAVYACLAATVVALFRRNAPARRAAMALAVVAATMYFCCSVQAALEGACLNGRYFYVVLPVLLPFLALALDRAGRPGRLWILFLLAVPVLYFLFVAPFLREADLVYAPSAGRSIMNLTLLWEPFPEFFGAGRALRGAGSLFAAALFGLSALACTRRGGRVFRTAAATVLLAAAAAAGRRVDCAEPPGRLGEMLFLTDCRPFREFRVLGPAPGGYFDAFRPPETPSEAVYLLADGPSRLAEDAHRADCASDLSQDDWLGRPLAWGKVHKDFVSLKKTGGDFACRATGRVHRGRARLALQTDGLPVAPDVPLDGGTFDVTFLVRVPRGKRGVNFRLALEGGTGEALVETTQVVPFRDGLPEILGPLPETTRIVDARGDAVP